MMFLLFGFLMAQSSIPVLHIDPYDDDNMIPAIYSWCEDNNVMFPTQDGKGKVGIDCAAEGRSCKIESVFNKYVDKYTIYAICTDNIVD